MLGHAVAAAAREGGHDVRALVRHELDIADGEAVERSVGDHCPETVINCAAYTDVDGAQDDFAMAQAVNGEGPGHLARAAAAVGALIIHVSTDYVFDGSKREPWVESDRVGPLGVYGATKLGGEVAVATANPRHAIVRTAWLFGAGGRNFVDTMLGVGAQRDEVAVVTDQLGSPTWTGHLASGLVELAERGDDTGVHHVAGGGACSWYDLAAEAFKRAGVDCRVQPTTSDQFQRPAPRPAYSVLGTERSDPVWLPPWQDGLQGYLDERMAVSSA